MFKVKHKITTEEYASAKEMEKQTTHKRVSKRLQVIMLRYEGLSDVEIGEKVDFTSRHVSALCAEFKKVGLSEYARLKYGGNHKSLSDEEEDEILKEFKEKAEKGEVVSAWEIKQAFDAKIGKDTGRGYIYMLLERKNWRKVMPRSQHPKKASDEAIDASKKLTGTSKS